MAFIFFSFLTALARTCNTVLNNSGESVNPCLIPHIKKSFMSFNIEYDASCGFFINTHCHVEGVSFYSYISKCFYYERFWIFQMYVLPKLK